MSFERKKEEFIHRGIEGRIEYFLSPSNAVERFDVYAVLDESEGETKIGASIVGWITQQAALEVAIAMGMEKIDDHLSAKKMKQDQAGFPA